MLKELLFCMLLSLAPVSELRGAIPVGLAAGIPIALLYPACVLANLIPVPLIIVFLRKVLAWMQRCGGVLQRGADWLIRRGTSKSALVKKYEMLGLFLLVAIPLPGTGAWTGALVAAMMEMQLKRAFPAIAIGVAIAGVIVSVITYGAQAIF